MAAAKMKYAQLDELGMEKVQILEQETGAVVLVMEKIYPVAKLSDAQISKVQALEKDLGVILIAYQS